MRLVSHRWKQTATVSKMINPSTGVMKDRAAAGALSHTNEKVM